jgi:catechol 2,3-dioxygenase
MTTPQPVAIAPHRISPETRPGYVHLKVAHLDEQIEFYQRVPGLKLNGRRDTHAGLGIDGRDLVRMTEIPNGKRFQGVTGIYHFAILFPNRRELARAVARLFSLHWQNYPTDHILTKTTYLDDPEGNTIELYCESPEDGLWIIDPQGDYYARRADGSLSNGREALDLEALFSNLKPEDRLDLPVPPETRIGHFHLFVSDLEETRHFYHDLLGFDDMGVSPKARMGMVSAGGYHHHIGFNTWQGKGAPPPPEDALGLQEITFTFPDQAAWQDFMARLEEIQLPYRQTETGIGLTDPSKNEIFYHRRTTDMDGYKK